jgi:hypothetical protein
VQVLSQVISSRPAEPRSPALLFGAGLQSGQQGRQPGALSCGRPWLLHRDSWVVKMGGKTNCFRSRLVRLLRLPENKPIDVQALKE